MRLKLQGVIVYLGRKDLSPAARNAGSMVAFRAARTVARLLESRKKLKEVNWTPGSAGGAGVLLSEILKKEGRDRC